MDGRIRCRSKRSDIGVGMGFDNGPAMGLMRGGFGPDPFAEFGDRPAVCDVFGGESRAAGLVDPAHHQPEVIRAMGIGVDHQRDAIPFGRGGVDVVQI